MVRKKEEQMHLKVDQWSIHVLWLTATAMHRRGVCDLTLPIVYSANLAVGECPNSKTNFSHAAMHLWRVEPWFIPTSILFTLP